MAHEKIANILQIYFIDIDVYWDDASMYLTLRTHPVTFPRPLADLPDCSHLGMPEDGLDDNIDSVKRQYLQQIPIRHFQWPPSLALLQGALWEKVVSM